MDVTINKNHDPLNGHLVAIPEGTELKSQTYASSDESIASVTGDANNFTINLIAVGTVTITINAESQNGTALSAVTITLTIIPEVAQATGFDTVIDNL